MAQAYLSVTLADGYGRTTSKRWEMTGQLLLADYISNANLALAELNDITDLEIIRANLVFEGELTLPSGDATGSNVDVGATFVGFVGDAENKKAVLKVPGITMAKVGTGGVIDIEDADVAAFLDLFGDPPNNKLKISDGEYIESWITGTLDR